MVIETDDSTATGRPDGLLYLLSRCQKTLSSMLNHHVKSSLIRPPDKFNIPKTTM